jgi:hypothetical protein
MQVLTIEQAADYLEEATIKKSVDSGYAIVHSGFSPTGVKFTLVNDMYGHASLIEVM